jgi:hypothetical protein
VTMGKTKNGLMTWMVWGFPHFRKPAYVLMCVLL